MHYRPDLMNIEDLWELAEDQAPPVPADEEEETERDLTARLTAQEFAALVDADRGMA